MKSSVAGKDPSANEPPAKKTKHVEIEPSAEEGSNPVKKNKVVWENYSKKDLYYKWLKARNDATDLRKERNELDQVRIS